MKFAYSQTTWNSAARPSEGSDFIWDSLAYNEPFESFSASWFCSKTGDFRLVAFPPAAPGLKAHLLDFYVAFGSMLSTGAANAIVRDFEGNEEQGIHVFPTVSQKASSTTVQWVANIWCASRLSAPSFNHMHMLQYA